MDILLSNSIGRLYMQTTDEKLIAIKILINSKQ